LYFFCFLPSHIVYFLLHKKKKKRNNLLLFSPFGGGGGGGGGRQNTYPKTGYSDVSVRYFSQYLLLMPGTAVAQWLRCCVTSRNVAGSIPAGVGGFFIDIKSF